MASPFSIFRKNQKVMLALLTLLAMFGFVFLPIILQGMGGGGSSNPVVAKTTKFGNLLGTGLTALRNNHIKFLEVLAELSAKGAKAAIEAEVAAGKLSADKGAFLMNMNGPAEFRRKYEDEGQFGPPTDENLVTRLWLLSHEAEQLGMVVSEEMIKSFLQQKTFNALKNVEIKAAIDGAGISTLMFFTLVRDELAVRELQNQFLVSLAAATPGQRWDYFNRIKREATIEAVAVPVANYVKQVADPTEKELVAFFEEHENREPAPESSAPGFRRPHKIAFEYFKADDAKFATPKLVTDAEVQEYYEKNKDFYDQFIEKPSEKKPAEKVKEQPKPPALTPAIKGETSTHPKKVEPKEETKAAGEKTKSKQTSVIGRASPIVLTSFQDEKAGETTQAAKKAAEPSATPQTPASKESVVPSTAPQPAPATKKVDAPKTGLPDSLRSRIRRDIAHERVETIFKSLREQLDRYGQKRNEYNVRSIQSRTDVSGQHQPMGPPPPSLDFDKLAKENGLSAGRTGPVSQREAQKTEIGNSVVQQIGDSMVERRAYVWQYAFQSLSTFRPATSGDDQGLYLFWKTEDEKSHIPKFTDKGVRDDVLQSWKMNRARDLAKKYAKSLADKADKVKRPLKEVFASRSDLSVALPEPFSWMTFGNVADSRQLPWLSKVSGVDMAGSDFMRTVFHLQPGQVGVAFNAPETVVYVVGVEKFSPSYKVRKAQFEVDDFRKYVDVGLEDRQEMYRAWLKEIQTFAGFEWSPDYKRERMRESRQSAIPAQPIDSDQPWDD